MKGIKGTRDAKRLAEVLDDLEGLGKLIALSARDLRKFHEETGGLLDHLEALKSLVERIRALHGELYALGAQAKRPYEDNSAETLRRLFL